MSIGVNEQNVIYTQLRKENVEVDYIEIKTNLEKKLNIKEKSLELNKQATHYEIRNTIPRCEKEIDELKLTIQAVDKQIPMKAYYEYDNEFICPACNYEDDGYDVITLKVCPDCGQLLDWS